MSLPIAGAAPALNLLPEDPHGPLTSNSSLIQKTRETLQKIFFREGSVLFVSAKEGGLSLFVYPRLNTVYIQSGRESTVHLSIELCEVQSRDVEYHYMHNIVTGLNNFLMIVKTHDPRKNIILSKIDKVDMSNPVMKWRITFQQFMQFVSSFLYLYKDVIDYIQLAEEDLSTKRLRKMLKSLLVQSHRELGSNGDALRELLISKSKELSLSLVTRSSKEFVIEDMRLKAVCYKNELEIKLLDIISNHGSKDDMVRLMINVSIQDYKTSKPPILSFISQCVTYSMWQCILMNRSEQDAIEIFKLIPRVMLREMSQDMLKSILIKISKAELVNIILLLPIGLLLNVLMKLCPDLLRKVLLDMPKNLLMSFQDELQGFIFVKKHLKDRILELGQIKNMHQGLQEDNIPTVPSLLVLSATAICRSSSLSLGGAQGLGGWPYTPLYVNKLLETYPKLKEDINRVGRMSIEPSLEGVPEIIFGESQSPEYSEEDDLLSLASMIPGSDNYIKHALLKNAK